jgi:hypothetical protein
MKREIANRAGVTTHRRIRAFDILCAAVAFGGIAVAIAIPIAQWHARSQFRAALVRTPLNNCTFRRYGSANDGGYVMCENLMGDARAVYSYGIDGRDEWGCDVSGQLGLPVQEYDCFNLSRPSCDRGPLRFHEECVGARAETMDGRSYDTVANQIARNGDSGKRLVMKMDVEGSEWSSLLATPEAVLDLIDQLVVEFHDNDSADMSRTMQRLAKHFYIVNIHTNNEACGSLYKPLTSWANEVLLVNKRLGVVSSGLGTPGPNPLDAPNNPLKPDCQLSLLIQ